MAVPACRACSLDAPACFGARDFRAMHRHAAPRVMRTPRASGRHLFCVAAAHHTIARDRRRAARVPIEDFAVGGAAFPRRFGFCARGVCWRLACSFRATNVHCRLRWHRALARRADQRLRVQRYLALLRPRRARLVLIRDMALRIDATVDRCRVRAGRQCIHQQSEKRPPQQGASDLCAARSQLRRTQRDAASSAVHGVPRVGSSSDPRRRVAGPPAVIIAARCRKTPMGPVVGARRGRGGGW